MTPEEFVNSLSDCESQKGLFNPFKDTCPVNDLPNAPKIRSINLRGFLEAQLKNQPRYLWVAEAPGYNGSRRSGIYLVSERDFDEVTKSIKSGRFATATKGSPKTTATANAVWSAIKNLKEFPLTFDALPFHPFSGNNTLSNRTPKRKEIKENLHFLETLIEWFKPKEFIAIGRKAEIALSSLGVSSHYVRHPAHGGQKEFLSGIRKIYRISNDFLNRS